MSGIFDFCCGGSDARMNNRAPEDTKAFDMYGHDQNNKDHDLMDIDDVNGGFDFGLLDENVLGQNILPGSQRTVDKYQQFLAEEEALLLQKHAQEEREKLEELRRKDEMLKREEEELARRLRELDEQEKKLLALGGSGLSNNSLTLDLSNDNEEKHEATPPSSSNHNNYEEGQVMTPEGKPLSPSIIAGGSLTQFSKFTMESDDESKLGEDDDEIFNAGHEYLRAGVEACYRKEYSRSKKLLKASVRLAIDNNDEVVLARAMGNLANVYESIGRSAKALVMYKASITLLRKIKDFTRERYVISNALFSYVRLKQYEEAVDVAKRQLEILSMEQVESGPSPELDQHIADTNQIIHNLQSAIQGGYEVAFDLDPSNRVLYAVSCNQSVYHH